MKYLFSLLGLLTFQTSLFSQDANLKKDIGGEPYPAPVMYNNVTLDEAAFIGLFENKQVSNLHVYADTKNNKDYFFAGTPITGPYSDFLPAPLSMQTFMQGKEPQAVFSMRGEAEELYVINLKNKNNEIRLYGMEGKELVEKQLLASYSCKGNRCIQIDSWVQDINGDTRLDIIQKKKTTRRKGKEKIKTTIYLMGQQGNFKKSKNATADLDDYQMQELW